MPISLLFHRERVSRGELETASISKEETNHKLILVFQFFFLETLTMILGLLGLYNYVIGI